MWTTPLLFFSSFSYLTLIVNRVLLNNTSPTIIKCQHLGKTDGLGVVFALAGDMMDDADKKVIATAIWDQLQKVGGRVEKSNLYQWDYCFPDNEIYIFSEISADYKMTQNNLCMMYIEWRILPSILGSGRLEYSTILEGPANHRMISCHLFKESSCNFQPFQNLWEQNKSL